MGQKYDMTACPKWKFSKWVKPSSLSRLFNISQRNRMFTIQKDLELLQLEGFWYLFICCSIIGFDPSTQYHQDQPWQMAEKYRPYPQCVCRSLGNTCPMHMRHRWSTNISESVSSVQTLGQWSFLFVKALIVTASLGLIGDWRRVSADNCRPNFATYHMYSIYDVLCIY